MKCRVQAAALAALARPLGLMRSAVSVPRGIGLVAADIRARIWGRQKLNVVALTTWTSGVMRG
jgi:hypothetical protein